MSYETQAELHELSKVYASAVDRRDASAFVSIFTPDAELTLVRPTTALVEPRIVRGHAELGAITVSIARYAKTFHLLGQVRYEVNGLDATGEIYCVAHHITPAIGGNGEDFVMYIRYADRYRQDSAARWKIARRIVQIEWTETRTVDCNKS